MTQEKSSEGEDTKWERLHISIDEESGDILQRLANKNHGGNESATIREAIRFLDSWKKDGRPLLPRIHRKLKNLEELCKEIHDELTNISEQLDHVIEVILLTANSSTDADGEVRELQLERDLRDVLSPTTPKSVEEIATELDVAPQRVRERIQKKVDSGQAKRLSNEGNPPKYLKH